MVTDQKQTCSDWPVGFSMALLAGPITLLRPPAGDAPGMVWCRRRFEICGTLVLAPVQAGGVQIGKVRSSAMLARISASASVRRSSAGPWIKVIIQRSRSLLPVLRPLLRALLHSPITTRWRARGSSAILITEMIRSPSTCSLW